MPGRGRKPLSEMPKSPKSRVAHAFSAGGVIFRHATTGEVEMVLVGRAYEGFWVLPKGTPRTGETHEQVALREVHEETGVTGRILREVGSIQYWFSRRGVRYNKEVLYYLMEATGGDVSQHDREYDDARWFPIAQAPGRLAYENEAEIVRRAEELIRARVDGSTAT